MNGAYKQLNLTQLEAILPTLLDQARQEKWTYETLLERALAAELAGRERKAMARLLDLARSGGLDGALTTDHNQFYATDYTKPLLFLADGGYLKDQATSQHLTGTQWGMMNETGNFPGQAWLWLYTFWYQIKPFSTSGNADALVWAVMALLTVVLALVPFIPGLRSIPRLIPLHRLIWRDYYRSQPHS